MTVNTFPTSNSCSIVLNKIGYYKRGRLIFPKKKMPASIIETGIRKNKYYR